MKLSMMMIASLIGLSALPAMAEAAVDRVAPVFSTPYQLRASQSCSSSSCEILFQKFGNETVIQHVSCWATTAPSSQATLVLLESTADTVATILPVFNYAPTGGVSNFVGINTDAVMFFHRGEQAGITFNATGNVSEFICTISGFRT